MREATEWKCSEYTKQALMNNTDFGFDENCQSAAHLRKIADPFFFLASLRLLEGAGDLK